MTARSSRRTAYLTTLAALAALALPSLAHARADGADLACGLDSVEAEPAWHAERCVSPASRPPAAAAVGATAFAFAHDVGPLTDNVVRHAIADFPGQTVLGPNALELFGYDFDPRAETLYALDDGGLRLGTMTLADGAFTPIGPSLPLLGHTWTGLAFHPRTGRLFASSSGPGASALYRVDRTTGTAVLIGLQPRLSLLIDISVNCAGVMYGHDVGRDAIYRIDQKTAAVTLVGTTGVAANFAQGMDFDNRTGKLYAYVYLGGGANRYGTVDLKTGALTPLSSNDPQGEFEGATQTRCPPPQTTITHRPARRTRSRWAVFRFEASVRGSSFACSLDGRPWARCASPVFRRVRPGAHRFAVRASDAAGNTDATPAVHRWRVLGR